MKVHSIAEKIHRAMYKSSPDPDAPENNNPDWLDGYAEGLTCGEYEIGDPNSPMLRSWIAYGKPERVEGKLREWRKGFWAAQIQRACEKSMPEKKPYSTPKLTRYGSHRPKGFQEN